MAAALCYAVFGLSTGSLLAHKLYAGASRIYWNENTFTIEVEHALLWHDVETAITTRRDERFSFDLGEAVSVPLMKEYILDRFILEVDGKYQPLTWVGMVFTDDKINVMFQAKLDTPPIRLLILDGLMTDVFDKHQNEVTVEANGKKWVHTLTRKDVEIKIDLLD